MNAANTRPKIGPTSRSHLNQNLPVNLLESGAKLIQETVQKPPNYKLLHYCDTIFMFVI
ncbi:hypothetical protein SS1G_07056 [Sclerotinia sclerotiorum 1980 UF-70]|uniref:Uncharacterized protein n=1 Tax=Sclerotinia sclerotiorum (strain ATCC 18683 / 1980 / Ss-1) TaxID=665079 RepID=A7EP07_SCLS1|nr:hypothetical protein SS1G_07056 [Sclerotinia sclerotiorum 1980 UF-70]EDO04573.1 hypothetical protein SS1G_07056 [Sclerotinia sclerotiorum 1980 UF-70]